MAYKTLLKVTSVAVLSALGLNAVGADERQMNVRQGPDSVFDQPVHEVMSELSGAEATGKNGRVGNELVFWGYETAEGREVFFFACAMLPGIDCDARRRSVCLGESTLIRNTTTQGKVRHVVCRSVAFVGEGDIRPGCADSETATDLAVGIVQCN